MTTSEAAAAVVILAQDLVWGDRLFRAVVAAGAEPTRAANDAAFDRALHAATHAIVDLTAHAYDPMDAVARAAHAGLRVLAVGPHDDAPVRKAARDAGAERVLAYRKMFEDGPATIERFLAGPGERGRVRQESRDVAADERTGATVTDRPVIPAARFADRLGRAREAAGAAGLDALLVGVGSDLRYLTGYAAIPLERLTMLAVIPGRPPTIVVPRLERSAAEAGLRTEVPILTWDETEDPYALVTGLLSGPTGRGGSRIGVSDTLWASHLLRLQAARPAARFEVASPVLRELRMVKDADEIALLRLAAQAADRVVARIAAGPLVGRTEADVAREVRERLVAEGHEAAHFAIVGSGPNSASPHHEASDRVIEAGEPIVLDIGGSLGGYGSDITRTLWVTGRSDADGPDERFRALFRVLYDAQAAATAAVRPGVACESIDAAAREPIAAAGYGERFIHRTGHGIGLDEHEEPYLVAGSTIPLREGMAFSVEPGIYFDGEYGARIEDIVVCGPDGPIVLNEAPRELCVVDG